MDKQKGNEMYALFLYKYDHYEWEELALISASRKTLEDALLDESLLQKSRVGSLYFGEPFANNDDERSMYQSGEIPHWAIEKIDPI